MERRHGWKIEPEWLLKTPGVVFALAMAVKAYTEPGDYVLIQEPVYYPFREVIESNDREVAIMYCIRMRMEVIRLILKILNGKSSKRGFNVLLCSRTIQSAVYGHGKNWKLEISARSME